MKVNIIHFGFDNQDNFKKALAIRTKVFVHEQNVPSNLEYDGKDEDSVHFLLFLNHKPIATSRYRANNKGFKLERFAVLKEYRGNKFGKMLLDYILEVVPDKTNMYLNSQASAVDFYMNNGFKTIGKAFLEAGIVHYKMMYEN